MSNPTNPGHPLEYMQALARTMLPGTPIGPESVFIQKGLEPEAATFPVCVINCPQITRSRRANNAKQAIFTVHIQVFYLWQQDTARTLETIVADLVDTLDRMADNVDEAPQLGYEAVIAGEETHIQVDGPIGSTALGHALISGQMVVEVRGTWYRAL